MKLLRHKVNLLRRYAYWRRESCIYIHIPKAAGTSINKAIYGRTLGHYTAEEIKSLFPVLFERSFVFSFVRNPWDRVLSAYRFAKAGRTKTMGMYKPEQYKIPEFDSFEKFLFEWLVHQNLKKVDYVFQPQYFYVCDVRDQLIIDFLGKVETLDDDIVQVKKTIGKEIEVGFENSTLTNVDFHDLYHNDDMINAVGYIYKKDVELFGYEF
ncbi:sulfotransferase family 2 domain-containing protein [Litchfieldella rifensis]|uniref:Sulfotransferase family 2 domain-containing protein n=1 Tax=Litchfieldella rifensis TaxID=762643 RepID=A0ABV7LT65_9GAMM